MFILLSQLCLPILVLYVLSLRFLLTAGGGVEHAYFIVFLYVCDFKQGFTMKMQHVQHVN